MSGLKMRIARLEGRFSALAWTRRESDEQWLELLGWAIQRLKRRSYRPTARDEEPEIEAMVDEVIQRYRALLVSDPKISDIELPDEWVRVLTSVGLDPTPEALIDEPR
jgi:hypothetical protein